MPYWRREDRVCYEGVGLPGSEEITLDEFRSAVEQVKLVEWTRFISNLPDEDLRSYLYAHERYHRLSDDIFQEPDESRPFVETMTVDEMSRAYLRYLGDDDDKASAYLAAKRAAKEYIRGLVSRRGE